MTVPEWLVVGVFSVFVAVIGWGIKRIVATNDQTNETLSGISRHLATMNGRLGKVEQWQTMHERMDDERHGETQKSHDALWEAVNGLRDSRT